jgi:hypothetical protein
MIEMRLGEGRHVHAVTLVAENRLRDEVLPRIDCLAWAVDFPIAEILTPPRTHKEFRRDVGLVDIPGGPTPREAAEGHAKFLSDTLEHLRQQLKQVKFGCRFKVYCSAGRWIAEGESFDDLVRPLPPPPDFENWVLLAHVRRTKLAPRIRTKQRRLREALEVLEQWAPTGREFQCTRAIANDLKPLLTGRRDNRGIWWHFSERK